MGKLIVVPYRILAPMTLKDLHNNTISAVSEVGHTHLTLPGSQETSKSSRQVCHANHSVSPVEKEDSLTTDIFGQSSSDSCVRLSRPSSSGSRLLPVQSSGSDLSGRLAMRLMEKTKSLGSMEFSEIWRQLVTPAGQSLWEHTVLRHRTSGKGCIGQPISQETVDLPGLKEKDLEKVSGWPTPVANDDNRSVSAHLAMKKRMGERDGTNANRTSITSLQVMVQLVPCSAASQQMVVKDSGTIVHGYSVLMENSEEFHHKKWRLNPFFSGWLMGFHKAWTYAGLMGLSRLPRRSRTGLHS